jgi:hypothetical protein
MLVHFKNCPEVTCNIQRLQHTLKEVVLFMAKATTALLRKEGKDASSCGPIGSRK